MESLLTRVRANITPPLQAVHEASRTKPWGGFVPELQANFAFTKAYLADSAGKKAGLEGPQCFVDLALFEEPLPSWIDFAQRIPWAVKGMSATFGELRGLDREAANAVQHEGILDAGEIEDRILPPS